MIVRVEWKLMSLAKLEELLAIYKERLKCKVLEVVWI